MARQIVDLRTQAQRQGITGLQQSAQAIAGILQIMGRAEKARRDREMLDRITRAIGEGKTNAEAIQSVIQATQERPQFGGGIQGILQKIGGVFQPPGGGMGQGIQQAIVGQRLQQALAPKPLLTPEEQREGALIGAGIKPRAKAPAEVKPFTLNETLKVKEVIQEQIDAIEKRDIAGIGRGQIRNVYFQEDILKSYINTVSGLELNERQRKQFNKLWDSKARKFGSIRQQTDSKGNVVKVGWNPNSPEVKRARKELRAGIKAKPEVKEVSEDSVRLQSAPDARLDPFWNDLSDEEKKEILQKLDENPDNIDEILRILEIG